MARIKVRYKGIADERTISVKDLESAGVEGVEKDLTWNRRNLFLLELDSSEKLEEVLRREGHFTISKVNDDNSDTQIAVADDPNREGDKLVDGDTGASTDVKKTTAKK